MALQSRKIHLGQMLKENPALRLSKRNFLHTRLSRTIRASKSPRAPWRTTTDLRQIDELAERLCVAERDEDETVVGEGAHHGDGGGFLSSS